MNPSCIMNNANTPWNPGTQILQQDLWGDKLITARPVTVVEDKADRLVLYTHPNAPYRSITARNRHSVPVIERIDLWETLAHTPLETRVSGPYHVLTLTPPNSWHSVWLFWDLAWSVHCWYVNLQFPTHRRPRGIMVRDCALDIRVEPDLSWSWKDRDEFDELVSRGWFADDDQASLLAEADTMARTVSEQLSPFSEGWEHWRPDPSWSLPTPPHDWHRLNP